MIGCAVSADLARYQREIDREDAEEAFIESVVHEHTKALAGRLLHCSEWIAAVIGGGGDPLANLAIAVNEAANGNAGSAAMMLARAFVPEAREEAAALLTEACRDFLRSPVGDPPTAASIDLSRYTAFDTPTSKGDEK